jgi:hypothetical protein
MWLIVLVIVILCVSGLLVYRHIRRRRDKELYYSHIVENMSDEEVLKLLNEPSPRMDYTYKPIFPKSKVVSAKKLVCGRISSEVHNALLLIHEDETITVRCTGDCSDCPYGDVE